MKFYSFDLDLDPMTSVLKLDLNIIKMYVCTKMKFLPSEIQKLSSEWTDTQTDRHTRLKLLSTAYTDGNKLFGMLKRGKLNWNVYLQILTQNSNGK